MTKARDIASAIPAPSTVSSAELGYLDGVTSAIQTQIDTKAPSSTAVTLTDTQTLTNKTLTNPVIASVVNNTLTSTTGDMIYASAANTPARLGIGSSAQVLTVASGVPSWATPAAGGGMTLLSTTTLSGATVTISSISQAYKSLYAIITGVTNATGTGLFRCAPNGSTTITSQLINFPVTTWNSQINGYLRLTGDGENGPLFSNANNSYVLFIHNYTSTTAFKPITVNGGYNNPGNQQGTNCSGHIQTTSAITSLVFSNAGGNLSTGTVLLYGVN